jgi:hypothetical protein
MDPPVVFPGIRLTRKPNASNSSARRAWIGPWLSGMSLGDSNLIRSMRRPSMASFSSWAAARSSSPRVVIDIPYSP